MASLVYGRSLVHEIGGRENYDIMEQIIDDKKGHMDILLQKLFIGQIRDDSNLYRDN